jgi:hypothetical protein
MKKKKKRYQRPLDESESRKFNEWLRKWYRDNQLEIEKSLEKDDERRANGIDVDFITKR